MFLGIDHVQLLGPEGCEQEARNFYEKLGFVIIEEKDFDIGQGFFMNDYVMEKKI